MSGVVDSFSCGVPWGILRVEGFGSGSGVPDLDIAYSMTAANDGCILVSVIHDDIDMLKVTVVRDGVPEGFVQMFTGELNAPELVLEVGDVVGDDFRFRYALSTDRPKVSIFADDPEEAAEVCVVIPSIDRKLVV
ncbi:hypothetical protein [Actinoplanes xinjiangensis]|uniref:hypothetical protein n=1 Tax=Actinoplanes xinjiangensis TaxID=512350 RepID=UPI00344626EA